MRVSVVAAFLVSASAARYKRKASVIGVTPNVTDIAVALLKEAETDKWAPIQHCSNGDFCGQGGGLGHARLKMWCGLSYPGMEVKDGSCKANGFKCRKKTLGDSPLLVKAMTIGLRTYERCESSLADVSPDDPSDVALPDSNSEEVRDVVSSLLVEAESTEYSLIQHCMLDDGCLQGSGLTHARLKMICGLTDGGRGEEVKDGTCKSIGYACRLRPTNMPGGPKGQIFMKAIGLGLKYFEECDEDASSSLIQFESDNEAESTKYALTQHCMLDDGCLQGSGLLHARLKMICGLTEGGRGEEVKDGSCKSTGYACRLRPTNFPGGLKGQIFMKAISLGLKYYEECDEGASSSLTQVGSGKYSVFQHCKFNGGCLQATGISHLRLKLMCGLSYGSPEVKDGRCKSAGYACRVRDDLSGEDLKNKIFVKAIGMGLAAYEEC